MRTTIDIEDDLLRRAKEVAARTNRPLRQVIEDALREVFGRAERQARRGRVKLKVSRRRGGLRPGVDIDNSAALLDLMEEGDAPV